MKTLVGIAFGPILHLRSPLLKIKNMVSGSKLDLGMRYCSSIWFIATLYEDPAWLCTWII
jgi:hypothetical protein